MCHKCFVEKLQMGMILEIRPIDIKFDNLAFRKKQNFDQNYFATNCQDFHIN